MLRPVKEFLVNRRLNRTAFLYILDNKSQSLAKISPAVPKTEHRFGLSLLPQLPDGPHAHPSAIFSWTVSDDPATLHVNSLDQPAFLALLHTAIREGEQQLEYLLASRARRQGEGWLSIVDERAPLVYGRTPDPDDTVGLVRCEEGKVLTTSYTPMPTYRLVSPLGIFTLPKPLHDLVLGRLEAANAQK